MSDQPNTRLDPQPEPSYHVVHSRGDDFQHPHQLDIFGGSQSVNVPGMVAEVETTLVHSFDCVGCQDRVRVEARLEQVLRDVRCGRCGSTYTVRLRPNLNPPGWEAIKNGE